MRKFLYSSAVLLSTISSSAISADPSALLERLNKEHIISVGPKSPFSNDSVSANPVAVPSASDLVQKNVASEKEESAKAIRLLKNKLAASRREVQALRKKQAAAAPAKAPDEQITAVSNENKQLQQQLRAHRLQLAETNKKHAQDAAKLQAISNENSQLQQQLKASQQQLAAAKKQSAEQSSTLRLTATETADHVKQLAEANKKRDEIKGQLDNATKKMNEQTSHIATLEEKLKQSAKEKSRIEQQLVTALAIPRAPQKEAAGANAAEKEVAKVSPPQQANVSQKEVAKTGSAEKASPEATAPAFSLAVNKSALAKTNYAWGVWFAAKVQLESSSLKGAGQKFMPQAFLQGFQDKFANSLQMKNGDIETVLNALNKRLGDAQKRETARNKKQAQKLLADAAKLKGAEREANGVVYLVEKRGQGVRPGYNDTIRFKVDEKVSSGKVMARGTIHTGRVSQLPPLMRAGVGKVLVGGRVKIYIPVELADGEQGVPGVVPPGVASTMTLEILSIEK